MPSPAILTGSTNIVARALLVGDRIDTKAQETAGSIATGPLTVPVAGGGAAVLFRFGALVLFDVTSPDQAEFLARLAPFVTGPYPSPETEEIKVCIDAQTGDTVSGDTVTLADHGVERFQLIADVLAKSVTLARYEAEVGKSFDRVEPIAATLQRTGRTGWGTRELVHHIAGTLLTEQRMVGRAAIIEKPDLLWDNPALERFYLRLQDEFELRERYETLQRKLELISRTAQTVLELLQDRRALRVEWYIVILIVVEILLTLYEMFVR